MTPMAQNLIDRAESLCRDHYGRVIEEKVLELMAEWAAMALEDGSTGYTRRQFVVKDARDKGKLTFRESKY